MLLVIVGATDKGQKEQIAKVSSPGSKFCSISSGAALKWVPLALGDGALGFWKALRQVYPGARETLLGSQDGQRLEQAAQGSAKESQGAPARHWPKPKDADRLLPGSLRAEAKVRAWPRTATSC